MTASTNKGQDVVAFDVVCLLRKDSNPWEWAPVSDRVHRSTADCDIVL